MANKQPLPANTAIARHKPAKKNARVPASRICTESLLCSSSCTHTMQLLSKDSLCSTRMMVQNQFRRLILSLIYIN